MDAQNIIPLLVGVAVVAVGGALVLPRLLVRAAVAERLRGGDNALGMQETGGRGRQRYLNAMRKIGNAVFSGKVSLGLKEKLLQAGYHEAGAVAAYMGIKALFFGIGLVGALLLIMPTNLPSNIKAMWIMAGPAGMYMIPNMAVSARRTRRCGEVRRHLPDAIDLLEICGSAGMGLDMAWNAVTDEVRSVSPTLADEMALCNLEIHLGAPRLEAMRHMAQRTGVDELSSLVAVLVQSERFGSSIGDSLRVFAVAMRETRSQHAQENAEKMAIKLIFPMILFIFPSAVMIMIGPAFMSLYRALGT